MFHKFQVSYVTHQYFFLERTWLVYIQDGYDLTISEVLITLSFKSIISQFSEQNMIKFEFFLRLNLLFCFLLFIFCMMDLFDI
jgi:hypothetical protein